MTNSHPAHDLDWYVCNLKGLQTEVYAGIKCTSNANLDIKTNNPERGSVAEITYRDLILHFYRENEHIKAILRGGRHRFEHGQLHDGVRPAVEIEYIELVWQNELGEKFRKFGPVSVSIWDYRANWSNGTFLMDQSSMVKEQFLNYDNREIFHEAVDAWKKQSKIKADHFSFDYITDGIHKLSISAELFRSQDTISK